MRKKNDATRVTACKKVSDLQLGIVCLEMNLEDLFWLFNSLSCHKSITYWAKNDSFSTKFVFSTFWSETVVDGVTNSISTADY